MEQFTKKNFKSNLYNIKIISKLLGVEINKPFKIQFFTHKTPFEFTWYKLTENGLMYSYGFQGEYNQKSDALEGLLIGKHQVVSS